MADRVSPIFFEVGEIRSLRVSIRISMDAVSYILVSNFLVSNFPPVKKIVIRMTTKRLKKYLRVNIFLYNFIL